MAKFKVGDEVVISNVGDPLHGQVGTIDKVSPRFFRVSSLDDNFFIREKVSGKYIFYPFVWMEPDRLVLADSPEGVLLLVMFR